MNPVKPIRDEHKTGDAFSPVDTASYVDPPGQPERVFSCAIDTRPRWPTECRVGARAKAVTSRIHVTTTPAGTLIA